MRGDFESDLAKWLLCRLMVKQGYSETDVAKHMEKNEPLLCAPPDFGRYDSRCERIRANASSL